MRRSCFIHLCTYLVIYSIPIFLAAGEMYTAQVEMENLSELQWNVVKNIEKYLQNEELRLNKIQMSLQKLKRKASNFTTHDNIGLNPIDSFVLIKTLTTDLQIVLNLSSDSSNSKALSQETENLENKFTFPTKEDLNGAAQALIRLQDFYLLNASSLSGGIIYGHINATHLTADDCFEIGRRSYKSENFARTIEWMNAALMKVETESDIKSSLHVIRRKTHHVMVPASNFVEEIKKYLQWAKRLQCYLHLTKNGKVGTNAMEGHYEHLNPMIAKCTDEWNENIIKETKIEDYQYASTSQKYQALCRGETIKVIAHDSKLHCSYNAENYYTLIGPVKQEIIHVDPTIVIFYQVIHNDEIEEIKRLSKPMFDRDRIYRTSTGGNYNNYDKKDRICKIAWLQEHHKVIAKVNTRIGLITKLSMLTAEDLQVANYGLGGHFVTHYDYARLLDDNAEVSEEGNRIATFLMYMNNVEAGGSTVFPFLGIKVRPVQGSALFWFNLLENGQGDNRTAHSSCPVLLGQKYVSNKWIHERGQEFLRPCRKV